MLFPPFSKFLFERQGLPASIVAFTITSDMYLIQPHFKHWNNPLTSQPYSTENVKCSSRVSLYPCVSYICSPLVLAEGKPVIVWSIFLAQGLGQVKYSCAEVTSLVLLSVSEDVFFVSLGCRELPGLNSGHCREAHIHKHTHRKLGGFADNQ